MWWISEGSKFHWSTVSEAAQAKGFCSKYLYLTITWGIWSIPVSTEERSCWEGVYTVSRSEVGMRTLVREEILTDHWHFVVYSGFDQFGGGGGGGGNLEKRSKICWQVSELLYLVESICLLQVSLGNYVGGDRGHCCAQRCHGKVPQHYGRNQTGSQRTHGTLLWFVSLVSCLVWI